MTLPNYLHVGQPKAGSTSLHFTLKQHPDVFLVRNKEAHFFDFEYEKGLAYYEETFFSDVAGQKVVADITPNYCRTEYLERIRETLGDNIKISFCARHPVARSYSHYCHGYRFFEEKRPFLDAMSGQSGYIPPSFAGRSLQKLYELFPRENIMVLIFERDIAEDRLTNTSMRLLEFLNIEARQLPCVTANEGYMPRVTQASRAGQVPNLRNEPQFFEAGDLLIETLQDATSYRVDVERSPSLDRLKFLDTAMKNFTNIVSAPDIRTLEKSCFEEDINLFRELVGDPIPEWTIDDRTRFIGPKMIESRLAPELKSKTFSLPEV